MSDEVERAAVTIKGMPMDVWSRAKRHAVQGGVTQAEWLARAINQLADREESAPSGVVEDPAPMIPGAMELTEHVSPGVQALRELGETFRAAGDLATQTGVPLPKTAVRHAHALLTAHLRHMRGLPPLKPRAKAPGVPALIQGS